VSITEVDELTQSHRAKRSWTLRPTMSMGGNLRHRGSARASESTNAGSTPGNVADGDGVTFARIAGLRLLHDLRHHRKVNLCADF
jgi:hypothetical protein